MKTHSSRAQLATVEASARQVTVGDRTAISPSKSWKRGFSHVRKDHRFYEIVEDTIMPQFEYRYFVLNDSSGSACAVQPFFLVDQDILEGASYALRRAADAARKFWPRFMIARTLMLGCSAGEGHLDRHGSNGTLDAKLIAREITSRAKALGATLIVLKEFPSTYRSDLDCFLDHGFARIPSLPMAELNLNYGSFEEYLSKGLTSRARSELRRKFRKADAGAPIVMSVVRDISSLIDQVYPLYLQVYARSNRHSELLTKAFFCELGRRMPDKVRFFIWRSEGRVIAFSLTLVHGDHVCNEYLGLDYDLALDRHLYFVAFRDVVSWAIANGYKRCLSTGLSYAPKLNLGFKLYPLDLYVRHTSNLMNSVLKVALPFIEPTRTEPGLRRFDNYISIHDDP